MMLFEPSPVIRQRIRDRFADMPAHLRPLWSAVVQGCTYATIIQGDGAFRIPTGRPAVVVIGDDLHASSGPGAFHRRSLRCYLPRCASVCIVTSEAVPDAYAAMATQAVNHRHDVALVETRPDREAEWLALVEQSAPLAKVTLCRPYPDGGPR